MKRIKLEARTANSTYKKLAVQWLNEALCFVSSSVGILLYPTIEKDYDLNFKYGEHNIKIRTVNLNTDWINIHDRLLAII